MVGIDMSKTTDLTGVTILAKDDYGDFQIDIDKENRELYFYLEEVRTIA